MRLEAKVKNSKGEFVVFTTDAYALAINAEGFETHVVPLKENNEPDTYKVIDFCHASDRMNAVTMHREMIEKWEKL
jgi:hypothetical protein